MEWSCIGCHVLKVKVEIKHRFHAQLQQSFSISLSIPGQEKQPRNCCFEWIIPWCALRATFDAFTVLLLYNFTGTQNIDHAKTSLSLCIIQFIPSGIFTD